VRFAIEWEYDNGQYWEAPRFYPEGDPSPETGDALMDVAAWSPEAVRIAFGVDPEATSGGLDRDTLLDHGSSVDEWLSQEQKGGNDDGG
jgi:hypothetical protein